MSAEPLSREEREAYVREAAAIGRETPMLRNPMKLTLRWDATVCAETARAEAAEKRAEQYRVVLETMHKWDHHEECGYWTAEDPSECDCFWEVVDKALKGGAS